MSATPFERLNPAVQYHVVNSLGWSTLRPTQLAAIDPILGGKDCLLLAPTAGGKTEAAVIPILSRIVSEHWAGLSVLYICPIKALLNNLEQRLSYYAGLLGLRVQLWHGDVSQTQKARAQRDAPQILLTTPESLEGMLISLRVDRPSWFGRLRVVVVDELHAFAGDDRGWHLRAVLGRIDEYAPERMQRIGLSATVGNPEELLKWLSAGAGGVVVGSSSPQSEADVTIDYVGSLENAATIISRLHRGQKRLVFCDSRARVEELATELRAREVRTFVSHSSLSADERRQAERAFGEESDCVIVATSTLELGIDVGDLDYVIQIDSPATVSSFLQRMGRTGRRSGAKRNCLFLTTSSEALMVACAVVSLWKTGYVEPIAPPPEPWHIVAQQIMASVLEFRQIGLDDCFRIVCRLFADQPAEQVRQVLSFMVEADILNLSEGLLSFGKRGEELYGRQNFIDLVASFASPNVLRVQYGSTELGYVEPLSLRTENNEPKILLLAGHSWRVVAVNWPQKTVWVEPTSDKGRTRWFGASRVLSFGLCQAIKGVLINENGDLPLSKRASAELDDFRARAPGLVDDATTVQYLENVRSRWWTFAGGRVNQLLRLGLKETLGSSVANDLFIESNGGSSFQKDDFSIDQRLRAIAADFAVESIQDTKFNECLPQHIFRSQVLARTFDTSRLQQILDQPIVHAHS